MDKKSVSIEEKMNLKRMKIKALDDKISDLSKKRNKLHNELAILEANEKAKKYESLELSLKETGLDLETLILKIKNGDIEELIQ